MSATAATNTYSNNYKTVKTVIIPSHGFCLFSGNALLPFQKCPPISLEKCPHLNALFKRAC